MGQAPLSEERSDPIRISARAGPAERGGKHDKRSRRPSGAGFKIYSPESKLEHAQQMAAHADPKTTRLYDRRSDEVSLDEVERIGI
jgi:hypothetical protein